MPEYLSPGVYVEEFESGGRPLGGVSTSTAGFLGLTQRGEVEGLPELVTSFADFQRKFGSYLSEKAFGDYRFLSYAVEHFFVNGGGRCYVMRVVPGDAVAAANTTGELLHFWAHNPGDWGNRISISFEPASKTKTNIMEIENKESFKYVVKNPAGFYEGDIVEYSDGKTTVFRKITSVQGKTLTLNEALDGDPVDKSLLPEKTLRTCDMTLVVAYGDEVEVFENLSFNETSPYYITKLVEKSALIHIKHDTKHDSNKDILPPFDVLSGASKETFKVELTGGLDGTLTNVKVDCYTGVDKGPGKRSGIAAFIDNDEVSIMAIPGVTEPAIQLALVAHCENLTSRFAVLDIPRDKKTTNDVMTHRNIFDTEYAAMYHPWLKVYDALDKRNIFIPPSGSIVGIYARTDTTRGVHKAPANEGLRATLDLDCQYNKGEQDILNPKGVNLIRYFTGQGIKVWGARTCSSNTLWRYVNVRRLFIFLEQSVKTGTDWVVFEPNDPALWSRVQRTVETFLTRVWRDGALVGSSAAEAFFVRVDRSTMTQDDIDNGRLICIIGAAPVKPAEFVIFRFTQKTSE